MPDPTQETTSRPVPDLSGNWAGKMEGTNHGGISVQLTQVGNKLSGHATLLEKEYGVYGFQVKGHVGVLLNEGHANMVLDLTPAAAAPGIQLGYVKAACRFTPPNQIDGRWNSTLTTNGTFSISRIQPKAPTKTAVFIVHGHDEAAKAKVALLVHRLGLRPIILNDQANQGQTIIEKFEQHAAEVGFAIVLFTPDDEGRSKQPNHVLQPRARQNVVLEMGYFVARLSRSKVCSLYIPNVELPTDLLGVVYTPMDSHGAWETKVAKEMKAAGLPIDLNHLA